MNTIVRTYEKEIEENVGWSYRQRPTIEKMHVGYSSWQRIISRNPRLFHSYIIRSEEKTYYQDFITGRLSHAVISINYADKLEDEINKSKYILRLKNNWDDEGAKKYDRQTWEKAIKFLRDLYSKVIERKDPNLIPKIYHGPDQSIDLFWDYEEMNLLINVAFRGEKATFSAENANGNLNGEFDLSNFNRAVFDFLF
jgi:hypothetical protein